jgi:hypothetical protein
VRFQRERLSGKALRVAEDNFWAITPSFCQDLFCSVAEANLRHAAMGVSVRLYLSDSAEASSRVTGPPKQSLDGAPLRV